MTAKEEKLFKALMDFHDGNVEKVHTAIINLVQSNDITPESGLEMYDKLGIKAPKPADETRAKTVLMSDPPQYDRCGEQLTAEDVKRIEKRKAEERRRLERERMRPRSYDPCGGGRQASC